jgi:hypothetical protein
MRQTKEEGLAEQERFQQFIKKWRRKNGGTTADATRAWRAEMEATNPRAKRAGQKKKLAALKRDPQFRKYLSNITVAGAPAG